MKNPLEISAKQYRRKQFSACLTQDNNHTRKKKHRKKTIPSAPSVYQQKDILTVFRKTYLS